MVILTWFDQPTLEQVRHQETYRGAYCSSEGGFGKIVAAYSSSYAGEGAARYAEPCAGQRHAVGCFTYHLNRGLNDAGNGHHIVLPVVQGVHLAIEHLQELGL